MSIGTHGIADLRHSLLLRKSSDKSGSVELRRADREPYSILPRHSKAAKRDLTMMSINHLPAVLSNYTAQFFHPNTKIFFIGFNKCATTSIHQIMTEAGIRSDHWMRGQENIALRIESVISSKDELRRYMRPATAYSDICYFSNDRIIEANQYFRQYENAYPEAYFVLNDRNVEAWIRSRASHRKGQLLERFMAFHETSADAVKELWRETHDSHVQAVLTHFSGNPKFLHFHVDRDPPESLTSFLAPTFKIDPESWKKINQTKIRAR